MSSKIQNPNQTSKGFIWAIVAVVVVAAVVIGYIIINGQNNRSSAIADREFVQVDMNATLDGDTLTLAAENVNDGAPEVELYEDYSCNYCAMLAENTDADMKAAIESGDLVVNIRTLNFLDRESIGHSTHALAAVLAVIDSGDPSLYWNYRALLLEDQEDIYNRWTEDDFADAAEAMGADSSVVDSIRSGENMDRAAEVATANGGALEEATGRISSPRVLQNGQDVEVEDINDWIGYVLEN